MPSDGENRPLADGVGGVVPTEGAELDRVARASLQEWSKTVFGAPRRLDTMVVLLEQQEEDLVRVATEIHRREIFEQRAPAPPNAMPRPAAVFTDPRAVDPWSTTAPELRTSTERIERCAHCNGSGAVACSGCNGSGLEYVWLAFDQVPRLDVKVAPTTALSAMYPQLRETKILTRQDLEPFVVHAATLSSGPIAHGMLAVEEMNRLAQHKPAIDRRLERVSQQQYVHFRAVRREVAYEMMGMRGNIVLAGARCIVELGPSSLTPIRARVTAWSGGAIVLLLVMALLFLGLRGTTAYFHVWNITLGVMFLLAAGAAILSLGAVLRIFGAGMRLQRPTRWEIASILSFALTAVGIIALRFASRPTVEQATSALAAGNSARAHIVIDALESIGLEDRDISALRDDVALLDATRLTGDERLARLDELASQGNTRSADAAKLAREDRLSRVRALVTQNKPRDALELADKTFLGADRELPEVQEIRAAVYESEYEACGADPCRFLAARKAERALPTPARTRRAGDLRVKLWDALAIVDPPAEALARLRSAKALDAMGQAVEAVAGDDQELRSRAKAAITWAQKTRDAVALLGSDRAVVEELLGDLDASNGTAHAVMQGMSVFVVFDKKKGTCTGVYIVGESKDARQQGRDTEFLPSILLQEALGHPAEMKAKGGSTEVASTTSWTDLGVPIVARFREGTFSELRIGDATPSGKPVRRKPVSTGKAIVSLAAFPGGQILLDNVPVGYDETGPLRIRPGKHEVKVKNAFVGDTLHPIQVKEGRNDSIVIVW